MANIEKIMCALDFEELSSKVADYAKTLSEGLNAKLFVVYVKPSLEKYEQYSMSQKFREEYTQSVDQMAKEKMNSFVQKYFQDSEIEIRILQGDIAKEIISFMDKESIDLAVIGSHGKKKVQEWVFGSVAEKMVKYSKVPILTIK